MKLVYLFFIALSFLFTTSIEIHAQIYSRTDTLYISDPGKIPVVDGLVDDEAWQDVTWNTIGEIWMPWGNLSANLGQESGLKLWAGENDFTGKYKVIWSEDENLLYFLVEVVDDVFRDGYVFPNNGYPDFDIVEIFLDENRSGGVHVFDGKYYNYNHSMTDCPTCNAENAFAYHIAVNAPLDGEVTNSMVAVDIKGTDWSSPKANYANHFPEFTMRKDGNTYTYEFSLKVYTDQYNPNNHSDDALSTLHENKVMGLTMAYCDSDEGGKRNHFFGSADVPLHAHNHHWINADWFGVAKLIVPEITGTNFSSLSQPGACRCLVSRGQLSVNLNTRYQGELQVKVLNMLGAEVASKRASKSAGAFTANLPLDHLRKGVYLVEVRQGSERVVHKVMVE
jgi:hypothetical protein